MSKIRFAEPKGSQALVERGKRMHQLSRFKAQPYEARMGGYGVRLLKAFEQWAKNRNVIEITLGVNSGVGTQAIGAFIQKIGYTKVGENYVK